MYLQHVYKRIAAMIAILFVTMPVFADQKLPEFTAIYAVKKYGIKLAEATYQLQHTPDGYRFSQHTKLDGVAAMFRDDSVAAVSLVEQTDRGLLLKQHEYIQTGKEKNRDENFSIEWSQGDKLTGHITGIVRSEAVDLQTDQPVWDVLSFQLPLMTEASADQKTYPYYALLKGELDTYFFNLVGTETVHFAGKDYTTLELVRKNEAKKRELRIWLIPELHNMPAKVENLRDGKQHSLMEIESLQFAGSPPMKNQDNNNNDFE
jgi:hypothetical protein